MSAWENDALYNPQTGALSKRGKDAFAVPDEVGKAYDDYTQEVRKGLTTDRQRVAFDKAAASRRGDIDKTLARHVFTEARKFEDTETENYVATAKQSAVNNYQDSARVDLEIARGSAAVADYAKRNGLGPEYVKQKTAQISERHARRSSSTGSSRMVKTKQPSNISTRPRTASPETTSRRSRRSSRSRRRWARASVARSRSGTSSVLRTTSIRSTSTRWSDDARATYGDKPEIFKAVTENLKERANIHNAAQRERREANSDAVWKQIDGGVPMAKVAMSPEFLALPGQEQTASAST
jgi:hypothetical protein